MQWGGGGGGVGAEEDLRVMGEAGPPTMEFPPWNSILLTSTCLSC